MESIWVSKIVFQSSGPLTFRRMPSGILHIMSYPFMPPTTMSGFLARLMLIAEGNEWPGYGKDWYGNCQLEINDASANAEKKKGKSKKPQKAEKLKAGHEYTLTLDKDYRSLGAFPHPERWRIHKTRRHGPKDFKHREFSELLRMNHGANYQLHHWDYLFCDEFTGWVAAKSSEILLKLTRLRNYGGKAGKEGHLTVTSVEEPRELKLRHGEFKPLGLVPQPARPRSGVFYNIYGHYWEDDYLWSDGSRGGVVGYTQLGAWWKVENSEGHYWAFEEGFGFPAHSPDAFLTGDVERFWEGSHE